MKTRFISGSMLCSNRLSSVIDIAKEIRQNFKDKVILVHANAGVPENIKGVDVFPDSPEDRAAMVPDLVDAGANIIGGCCGTTPDHLRAIKRAALFL